MPLNLTTNFPNKKRIFGSVLLKNYLKIKNFTQKYNTQNTNLTLFKFNPS